tara:strand:+ start:59 stop:1156 length:1098 start_codon:yes stop_codon:yes gene_type:complete
MINILRIISYFFKKNRKFIFLTDDITPRLNKICKALDHVGFSYELIILENLSKYNNLDYKKKNILVIKDNFFDYLKLLKFKGSTFHLIINSNLDFYNNLIKLKIFKCLVDFYDHKFLYKQTESITRQQKLEHNILENCNGIISRTLGLKYQNKNKKYKNKKLLFLDYSSKTDLQKQLVRKKYYNLLIIFPRWNSLLIYKNLEYIFNLLLGQNFKIYLILNPENIKNLNELKRKNNFNNIYYFDFLEHRDYVKNLENMDAYLWISINELIESTSQNYVYKLSMHRYAASNRIYEMIERNIFSASPRITKFDSYILNRYSHAYIYNALEDLKNLRFELEKKIGFKNKDISKILINNNINRLIKFYKS